MSKYSFKNEVKKKKKSIEREEEEGKGPGQQFKMQAHLFILIGTKQWRGVIV